MSATTPTAEAGSDIARVGIVGGGIMGSGIAEVCARAVEDVILVEIDAAAAERARARVQHSLERAVQRGKLEPESAERAMGVLTYTTDFGSLHDRQVVIEAVVEDKATKQEVFKALGREVPVEAILASNTSSIPIVDLAVAAGEHSSQVLGMHFFNPVPVLALVELIPSLLTDEAVTRRVRRFVTEQLHKDPIIAPDRAGFTVNALLIPYLLAAIRMFEHGMATAEDIDMGMVKGCAHPMGPLALSDLIGLDTVMSVAETLYAEHREQLYAPPPLLQRLVAAGLLGRKTGRGLYSYQ